jgi:hypothetical protein
VTPQRVSRWEDDGGPDVVTYNYLFLRDDACSEIVAELTGDER